jgi:histidinol-phosphate aminotransferase
MILSRRTFLRGLGAGTTALTLPAVTARGLEAATAEPWGGDWNSTAAPDVLRLDSNENPMGPPRAALDAVRAEFSEAGRYPYYASEPVLDRLAVVLGVPKDHLILGCGSAEILRMAVDAFTGPRKALVTAAPTYESPTNRATVLGVSVIAPPLDRSLRLDLDAMCGQASQAGLVFFCNPNNPSGTLHGADDMRDAVRTVLRRSPDAVVLVDEAYHEYVDDPSYQSMIPLALAEPRVVVSRTFSKIYGMAGLRLGYGIGHPDTLARMTRHRLGNSVNLAAAAAGAACLRATGHVARERARNREVREYTRRFFQAAGYDVGPSHTNFVLVHIGRPVTPVRDACRDKGVLIGRAFPPLDHYMRVSIGTMEEMRKGLPVIKEVLGRGA